MTKLRAPATIENALFKVLGTIGAEAAAAAVKTGARYVTSWSDPDTRHKLPVEAAIQLDLAYQAAGGEGAPIYETYGLLLDAARAERFADEAALATHTVRVLMEGSEAHVALVIASQPGASPAQKLAAAREVEEAVAELTQTLPLLTKGAGPIGADGEGTIRGDQS